MQVVFIITALLLLAWPAAAQDLQDVRVTRINLVWHEQEAADIPRTCISIYGFGGPLIGGCFVRRREECHIYTPVIRSSAYMRVAGHELSHCLLGFFHARASGQWIIDPLPLPLLIPLE